MSHVLNGFERNHDIDRSIRQGNSVSGPRPSVNAVSSASVDARSFADVDANYRVRACHLKRRCAVTFTAGNVQNALLFHESAGEGVPKNVFPKGVAARSLGHHSFSVVIVKDCPSYVMHGLTSWGPPRLNSTHTDES
jgi:hypothetical protein